MPPPTLHVSPFQVEEGLCQLIASLWLQRTVYGASQSQQDVSFQWRIENHSDPVYREGYQDALAMYAKSGSDINATIRRIVKSKGR